MRLKIVENVDSRFTLDPTAQADLFARLESKAFCQQVAAELKCDRVEFLEVLFQPVPYTPQTPKGMPMEIQTQYYQNPDFAIINVPPPFMFQAKIFKPSRLCAVYRKA